MTSDVPVDPTINDAFRQMSALIYAGADAGSIHQSLVDAALRLVEGCDRASLLVRTRDRYVTAASTDDIARAVVGSRASGRMRVTCSRMPDPGVWV